MNNQSLKQVWYFVFTVINDNSCRAAMLAVLCGEIDTTNSRCCSLQAVDCAMNSLTLCALINTVSADVTQPLR